MTEPTVFETKQINAAVAADRAPCKAIMESPHAQGRSELAKNLAYRCT
jgi:hypothetical protein